MSSSNTTVGQGPRPITGSSLMVGGRPVDEWRRIAREAFSDVQLDPNDQEAIQTLKTAKRALRFNVQENVRPLMQLGTHMTNEALRDESYGQQTGPVQAYAANALHGLSLGIGDDITGVVTGLMPGGLDAQQGRDRYRVGREQLYEDQPLASPAGDISGSIGLGVLTGGAFPKLGAAMAMRPVAQGAAMQAFRLAPRAAPVAADVLRGSRGAAMGAGALIGGGEGVVRGLVGEGDVGNRLVDAATLGGVGALTGGATVGVSNYIRGRLAERVAKRRTIANNADESDLALAERQATQAARIAATEARSVSAQGAAARADLATEDALRRNIALPDQLEARALRDAASVTAATERAALAPAREAVVRQRATLGAQAVRDRPLRRQILEADAAWKVWRNERIQRMGTKLGGVDTPDRAEASLRAWGQRQGMSQDNIEMMVARARRTPGSGMARPGPVEVQRPVSQPAVEPVQPANPAAAEALPTRGEAVVPVSETPAMVKGRHGSVDASIVDNQPSEVHRRLAGLMRNPPDEATIAQLREALNSSSGDVLREALTDARSYGWMPAAWAQALGL